MRKKIGELEQEIEVSRKYRVKVEKILKQATDALVLVLSVLNNYLF